MVDLQDFGLLKGNFGATGSVWEWGDFNGDTFVDLQDFGLLKDHFGDTYPLSAGETAEAAGEPAYVPADMVTAAAAPSRALNPLLDFDADDEQDPVGWDLLEALSW